MQALEGAVGQMDVVTASPIVDTSSWAAYDQCSLVRTTIFSDRPRGAALGGLDYATLTSDHPHPPCGVTVRATQLGHLRLTLGELATSPHLLAQWAGDLPHTTVLDVGRLDLVAGRLRTTTFAWGVFTMTSSPVPWRHTYGKPIWPQITCM